MAKSKCLTCVWEDEHDKKVDNSRTNKAWGRKVGVSEASIRRHKDHSPVIEQVAAFTDDDGDLLASAVDIPMEFVTSRGMSLRDPVTGSWQKMTWHPNRKALHDSLQYDDLKESLEGWKPDPFWALAGDSHDLTHQSERVSVLNMADLQVGKANQRWGGTPETISSVRRSVSRFAEYVVYHSVKTVVLVDNGDPIENVWNTPAQLVTNDLDVPAQIRTFRRLVLETMKTIAPHVDELYYVSIPSNHGQARTGYKSPGGTVDADFGLEISHQLEDATKENPHLQHITYVRPEPLDETAVLEIANTKLAFNHGHQSGGIFKHGQWWKGMDHGRMAGWDADIFVFGHFHTSATYQSGDGRWVVAVASSDPGSDWFTNRTGESSTRGMTAFDLDPLNPGVPQNVRVI